MEDDPRKTADPNPWEMGFQASKEQRRREQTLDALADLYLTNLLDAQPTAGGSGTNARRRDEPSVPAGVRSGGDGGGDAEMVGAGSGATRGKSRLSAPAGVQVDAGLELPLGSRPNSPKYSRSNLRSGAATNFPAVDAVSVEAEPSQGPGQADVSGAPGPHVRTKQVPSGGTRHHQHNMTTDPGAPVAEMPEAVFIGNLPGFGDAWLTQYAHHLAQREGPIGIIRVEDRRFHLSVVTPHNTQAVDGDEWEMDLDEPRRDRARPAERPVRWLIRLRVPASVEEIHAARYMRRLTLLCGADDAAVVAAYRLLKQAFQSDPSDEDGHDVGLGHKRSVGLMVFGSDAPQAEAAAKKLNATVTSFLQTHVELIGYRKQMQPVGLESHGAFDPVGDDLLDRIRAFVTLDPIGGTSHVDDDPRPAADKLAANHEPDDRAHRDASRRETTEDRLDNTYAPWPLLDAAADSSDWADDAEPTVSTDGLDVVRLLGRGGTLIKARCPDHRDVSLVVDAKGVLVICSAMVGDDTGSGSTTTGMQSRVATLLEVRVWAARHIELLALTCPQAPIDAQREPEIHLMTDRAKSATAAATRLGKVVSVHLLIHADVGDGDTWVGRLLN